MLRQTETHSHTTPTAPADFPPVSFVRFLSCFDPVPQIPKTGKGKAAATPINKERFISKMFLRGDSVILVLRNPK